MSLEMNMVECPYCNCDMSYEVEDEILRDPDLESAIEYGIICRDCGREFVAHVEAPIFMAEARKVDEG